jgi:hypothetical protein
VILWLNFPKEEAHRMWNGFDPSILRDLAAIREMVSRQRQTPIKEWPLVQVEEYGALLVVREWPDGSITAYAIERP